MPARRIRVGFDARWYNDSGVGSHVAELLGAMSQLRDEIELIIYEDPGNPVPGLGENPGVKRIPVTATRYSLREQLEFPSRLRRDGIGVFHSPFYVVPMMARCPVVVTVHDLIPFKFQIYPAAKTLVVKSGYRLACRKASHIIAVSQTTAEDIGRIIGIPAQKITPVHNAVSRQRFHAHASPQEAAAVAGKFGLRTPYIVVASARNWKTKNLGTALEALEIASRQTGQNFQTAIYGPGDGFDAAGGEGRWKLLNPVRLGYLKNEELAMLFRHANGFVFPSLYEGFGLPILEAMACGCPVITSSGGALAEVAGNGAQVFDPRDAEGMAGAVIRLLNDPEQREQCRLSGLARAAEFSWERAARETLAVYYRTYNQAYGS